MRVALGRRLRWVRSRVVGEWCRWATVCARLVLSASVLRSRALLPATVSPPHLLVCQHVGSTDLSVLLRDLSMPSSVA